MDAFLANISSFPVSVYTIGLVVIVGYWLIALVGLFDLDFISAEVDIDFDTDVGELGTLAGLLTTLGLSGVPITIVISLLVMNGWFICYVISKFFPHFPDLFSWIEFLIDLGIVIVSFMLSILVTSPMVRPLKKIFNKINNDPISRSVIGRTCRIRSSRVDHEFGEAECIHQGASLILKVRSYSDSQFETGEQVVLVEHQKKDNTFLVISEKEFNKNLNE